MCEGVLCSVKKLSTLVLQRTLFRAGEFEQQSVIELDYKWRRSGTCGVVAESIVGSLEALLRVRG